MRNITFLTKSIPSIKYIILKKYPAFKIFAILSLLVTHLIKIRIDILDFIGA